MKTLLTMSILMVLFFISCEKDPNNLVQNYSHETNAHIKPRTVTTPGSFAVNTAGILSFPTVADFHQTVEYINTDTTDTQLNSFRTSFATKTLNKQAEIIIDSVDNFLFFPSKVPTYWSNYI